MYEPIARSVFGRGVAALRAALGGLLLWGVGTAWAGYITTNESGLRSIFSQSGFGSASIDTRFNAGRVVADSGLLTINSNAAFNSLYDLSVYSPPSTINIFFVDAISYCGIGGSFIGCASTPGNVIALNSGWAANPTYGANLAAHEIGHNLGLGHASDPANLMYPSISTKYALDASQITTIWASSLVQNTLGQNFLSITPIAVVASVPEPHVWVMFCLGLLGVAGWVRRRAAQAEG